MDKIPNLQDAKDDESRLQEAMKVISSSPYIREKERRRLFQEFSSFDNEALVAKKQEILEEMEREGDEMHVNSARGRQVDVIEQIMRQRGLMVG